MAESLEARVASLAGRHEPARGSLRVMRGWDLADMALALRWGALCFAVISAFSPLEASAGRDLGRDLAGVSVLFAYGVFRTIQPLRSTSESPETGWFCLEAALCTGVAGLTGGWSSPMLLMVGCALLVAGLQKGFRAFALALATVLGLVVVVEVAAVFVLLPGVHSTIALQRIPELAAMGLIGAYAHRTFHASGTAYNRLRWTNELHALLLELYAVAAEHPGLFTVEGAVHATTARLRDVLSSDVFVFLLRNPDAGDDAQPWDVAVAEGLRVARRVPVGELPAVLARCVTTRQPLLCERLFDAEGLDAGSTSGLYAPILVRGSLAGLLAVERRREPAFTTENRDLIAEIGRHAGLAIDNARSFSRLRSLGAEEERERIARELHDRVGQSLAAVAFNIDRITASLPAEAGDALAPELEALSREVRAVNGEIREKLTELRDGPTANVDLIELLDGLLSLVETRSMMRVDFACTLDERLPELVEREIWRIACEAIRNAERHSGGTHLSVSLHGKPDATILEVADDGRGVEAHGPRRPDAYGLRGMHERAERIGGTLVVGSDPSWGTTVRLEVPRP